MPDLNTVRASAPAGVVIVETLEFLHDSFPSPIRLVNDFAAFDATLEATAPEDASTEVSFEASRFALVLPRAGDAGTETIDITISNVDQVASDYLQIAMDNPGPITVIYRIFLSTDTSGPAEDPPTRLTLDSAIATATEVVAKARNSDNINRKFPSINYNIYDHPGLSR
ncbi:MAG: DUF1833 family protein [Gammaproteobacteria bacterium]|nr:DUF1833 family protein [Gammaproteobacteria bacterium]